MAPSGFKEIESIDSEVGNVQIKQPNFANNENNEPGTFSQNVADMMTECLTSAAITEIVAAVKEGEAVSKTADLSLKDIRFRLKCASS